MAPAAQSLDVSFAWLLYGVHMMSLPIWLASSAWALRKVRAARKVGPAGAEETVPLQAEYISVHMLAFYVLADMVRGMDGIFDCADGTARSTWGVMPMGGRCVAWALRDVALLGAIGLYLEFIVGWTHAAMGWASPRAAQDLLRWTFVVATTGIFGCFFCICLTNRQSWQAVAVLFVVLLNVVWAWTNLRLLRTILPQVEARLGLTQDVSATLNLRPDGTSDGTPRDKQVVAPWVSATVAEARLVARLVLAANVFILAVFPFLALERLVLRGAYWQPIIATLPVGSWVAGADLPRISEMPLGLTLNPSLEVVELTIGWLQWVYVVQTARKPASARPPAALQEPGRGYVGSLTLGNGMRAAGKLGKCS